MVQGVVPVPCTHMFYATVMNGYTFTVTWVTSIYFRCREEYYRLVTLMLKANASIYYPWLDENKFEYVKVIYMSWFEGFDY